MTRMLADDLHLFALVFFAFFFRIRVDPRHPRLDVVCRPSVLLSPVAPPFDFPLRRRRGYNPRMSLLLAAVTFSALCVWLAVRIVNRREKWAKWMAVALAVVLVGYPLSFGPACWISDHWQP